MTAKKLIILFTFLILSALAFLAFPQSLAAQTPPPPPDKPTQTPIDGGLGLLAVAGGAYAIKKLKDRRK